MIYSQNGYPALGEGSKLLHRWKVPGTQRLFTLRQGPSGFLLVHFIVWFDEEVESLIGMLDDYGHSYRVIRDSKDLSNHASGTAVDLNSTKHPMGALNTFTNLQESKIHRRLQLYDECIRWGGDYYGRKDEMHFEINRSIAVCEKVAQRLASSPVGQRILAANPGQKRIILS